MLSVTDSELPFLKRVVANQKDLEAKQVYADWLEENGDQRATFLRGFVQALEAMDVNAFPQSDGIAPVWRELMAYDAMKTLAEKSERAVELRDKVLELLMPTLRIETEALTDDEIPVGVSKYGGNPDLPAGFAWPLGKQCDAIFNDDTDDVEDLSAFLMQLDLTEVSRCAVVDSPLPSTGMLSIFCHQDDDNPDCIGVGCFHQPQETHAQLQRTSPPRSLPPQNEARGAKRIHLVECLTAKLPEGKDRDLISAVVELQHEVGNQCLFNFSDYQTEDRHFLGILKNDWTTVFINVSEDATKTQLSWVDFDGDSGFK